MKNYWIEGLAVNGNDIRNIEVSKDGLLIRAEAIDMHDLLCKYEVDPVKNRWYFNKTRDREIATIEYSDLLVYFNPQLLWQNNFEIHT